MVEQDTESVVKKTMEYYQKKYCLQGWAFLFLMPVLNFILPQDWGLENSVVENLQMIFVLLTLYWCLAMARQKDLPDWGGSAPAFWYAGFLMTLLLVGREISWGRAFFPSELGYEMIQWEEMGLYGKLAHPLIGILIAITVWCLWRSKFWIFVQRMWKHFAYPEIILLIIFVIAQYVAEHMSVAFWHGELAEELAETGAYIVIEWLVRGTAADYKKGEWA